MLGNLHLFCTFIVILVNRGEKGRLTLWAGMIVRFAGKVTHRRKVCKTIKGKSISGRRVICIPCMESAY